VSPIFARPQLSQIHVFAITIDIDANQPVEVAGSKRVYFDPINPTNDVRLFVRLKRLEPEYPWQNKTPLLLALPLMKS
jgi:hypothetical protein